MRLTVHDRASAFAARFPHWPAAWPRVVQEQRRDVLYATWVIGANYRNRTRFYGAYPAGFLARLQALFPDIPPSSRAVLHAFSGSLPPGPYVRLDCNAATHPDVIGSVYAVAALVGGHRFHLVCADPPYSAADAARYDTPMVDRRRAIAALAGVVRRGGFLAWLDTVWPMHNTRQWVTVGRIFVQRSTNHRVRVLSLFEAV